MSETTPRAAGLDFLYRPIASEMEATTALLKERLFGLDPAFSEYLDHSFRLGGKRLRPALTLLCGKAAGAVDRRHYLCAAALEMIHTGSLVHDDILDGARFRRRLETVNARWDSQRAVL
ncbi:MAG: polyprenyl synthetase family protein, partial [Thermoguttaceae bacterium]|nr:polyprenyl synthetase family protein [Thermoguttaceae bacterium]